MYNDLKSSRNINVILNSYTSVLEGFMSFFVVLVVGSFSPFTFRLFTFDPVPYYTTIKWFGLSCSVNNFLSLTKQPLELDAATKLLFGNAAFAMFTWLERF